MNLRAHTVSPPPPGTESDSSAASHLLRRPLWEAGEARTRACSLAEPGKSGGKGAPGEPGISAAGKRRD